MTLDVAIVGGGAAGAGVAYALRDADASVTVFEASDGVGGRAATRRAHGCTYDYGANYVKADDDRVAELVSDTLATSGLVDVTEPVWTFDAHGEIAEGRAADPHKWSDVDGISRLIARAYDAADASIETGVRIVEPIRVDGGWGLRDDRGADRGRYDALVLTPPAPETADLLGSANWEHRHCRRLRESIAVVPYRTIVSVALHYPDAVDWPYYALVNTDKEHAVGWVSREECKEGHVPDGETLLIAQMGPDWSIEHYDRGDDALATGAASEVATLLEDDALADPDWTDVKRWRYALPETGAATDPLDRAAAHDLYFAGDWVAGAGRVHAAMRSGLDAGERIRDAA